MSFVSQVLGTKLPDLRLALNLTQEGLASYMGIATCTLRPFEQGKKDLSPRLHARAFDRLLKMLTDFAELRRDHRKLATWAACFRDNSDLWKHFVAEDWENTFQAGARQWVKMRLRLAEIQLASKNQREKEGSLTVSVSQELLYKFNEERQARRLTSAELLELILTHYFQNKAFFTNG